MGLNIKMKPSDRINEISETYKENPEDGFIFYGNVLKSILRYLDEEWEKQQPKIDKEFNIKLK